MSEELLRVVAEADARYIRELEAEVARLRAVVASYAGRMDNLTAGMRGQIGSPS